MTRVEPTREQRTHLSQKRWTVEGTESRGRSTRTAKIDFIMGKREGWEKMGDGREGGECVGEMESSASRV